MSYEKNIFALWKTEPYFTALGLSDLKWGQFAVGKLSARSRLKR